MEAAGGQDPAAEDVVQTVGAAARVVVMGEALVGRRRAKTALALVVAGGEAGSAAASDALTEGAVMRW